MGKKLKKKQDSIQPNSLVEQLQSALAEAIAENQMLRDRVMNLQSLLVAAQMRQQEQQKQKKKLQIPQQQQLGSHTYIDKGKQKHHKINKNVASRKKSDRLTKKK